MLPLKASINFTGRTSMVVGVRVKSKNIRTGEVKHCNSLYFTMVAKGESGKSVAIPGIILIDKRVLNVLQEASKGKKNEEKIYTF